MNMKTLAAVAIVMAVFYPLAVIWNWIRKLQEVPDYLPKRHKTILFRGNTITVSIINRVTYFILSIAIIAPLKL